jgi:type IV pilus assembly protein PilQ
MCHNKNLKNGIKNKWMLFISGFVVQAILMVLAVTVATAFGDVMAAGAKENVNAKNVKVSSSEDIAAGETVQSITFDKDMTIKDGLRVLSAMYKKNIVPSVKVDGVMGFTRLYNVTFEEAMDAILGANFKYEQKGQVIKVYTKEEYKKIKADKDRMVYKTFTLYYITAEEAGKLIKPVLSEAATVAVSTTAKADTEAGEGGDSLALHDTIVVYDFPENIEKVSEMIEAIDVKPPAILIEVTILEAELKDETKFGIDWSSVGSTSISLGSTEGISTTGFASAVTGSTGLTAAFTIDDVVGFIRALESITDTTVLANPKILALNKQAGHLLIGAEDGYLTTTQVSEGGVVTQQVEFLESGTTLKFRPYICKDGYIRMEISPEQSEGSVSVSGDFVLPSKTTTQVKTNIMVKDGKTIVIGGLFKEEIEQTYSQVPVLGDLPLAGTIFRQTNDTSTRKELIILITPHIITDPEQTLGDDRAEDADRLAHGARKALNWISRARIFDDRYAKAVQYYTEGDPNSALSELNYILSVCPTHLEAMRLKERILREISPDKVEQMERIMLGIIEREESNKWLRR